VLELALIENLQRENLNPIEEAQGYSQLIGQFQLTQEEVATKVGKSRTVVANALRLLKLPPTLQGYVREGRISVGHAKVILGLVLEKQQQLAAERIIKEGLNVRQTEGLVAKLQARGNGPERDLVGDELPAVLAATADGDAAAEFLGNPVFKVLVQGTRPTAIFAGPLLSPLPLEGREREVPKARRALIAAIQNRLTDS